MKKTLLLAGVASALFAFNANAVELNPYVSAKFKFSDMSSKLKAEPLSLSSNDTVPGFSLAAGISFKTDIGGIRTELEYSKNGDAEDTIYGVVDTTVESQSVLVNTYYDIKTDTNFTPYIGAGLGVSKIKGKMSVAGVSDSMDDNSFTWQVGGGVSVSIAKNAFLDAGYRYVDYGDIKESGVKLEVDAHEFYIGARYAF